MPSTIGRAVKKVGRPREFAAAVVRNILPNSPRYGPEWVRLSDGSVTFRERGFVSADGPIMLLARHNYELNTIHTQLAGTTAARSLEIGCGFGRLSKAFAEHSCEHIAIDINNDALAAARATYPELTFKYGSAEALPYPDGYFDLICTWTVLQHIRPEKIEAACAEIRRVLDRSGGVLLIVEETRNPHDPARHTWHRRVSDYQRLLHPLDLESHGYIDEISRIPGMVSPGEVMRFRYNTPATTAP